MQATGNWVFIKRDDVKEEWDGVEIAEKSLTQNMEGVITHIRNDNFVTIGDRVLVPHYGTVDYLIGGIEYAVAKVGNLFAKMSGDTYLPVNGYVKVRKCVNDHIRDADDEIVLHMTDRHIENTNWVEILDVADDCEHITKDDIGSFCVAPESDDLLQRILYSPDYCLHESKIEFLTDGD